MKQEKRIGLPELERCWKSRDGEAIEKLVKHYFSIIKHWAYFYYERNLEFLQDQGIQVDYLIPFGEIGMIEAIRRFDIEKRTKHHPFTSSYVQGAIIIYLSKYVHGSIEKDMKEHFDLPLDYLWKGKKEEREQLEIAESDLQHKEEKTEFTAEELAKKARLPLSDVKKYLEGIDAFKGASQRVSAEGPKFPGKIDEGGEKGPTIKDSIVDKKAELLTRGDPDFAERRKRVLEILSQVPPRDRKILMYRFGFKDGIKHTAKETAQKFGLTQPGIQQIEVKWLRAFKFFISLDEDEISGL